MPVKQRARINLESNKIQPGDHAVHDWYRFVLSFPPHLVRNYLQRFDVGPKHLILDPFCGTGTTLVECKKNGIPSMGIEANPMAHFATTVKTDWRPSSATLRKHANDVADETARRFQRDGLEDDPLAFAGINRCGPLLKLSAELDKLLLTNSISPLPLHKTLVLEQCVRAMAPSAAISHLRLALAKAVVGQSASTFWSRGRSRKAKSGRGRDSTLADGDTRNY